MNDKFSVLDTDVLVSALIFSRSVPRQAFNRAFALGSVLASTETLYELDDVLRRRTFDRYLSEEERLDFLATYINLVTPIEPIEIIADCRDPKDNKFLEPALGSGATFIITGDTDLLALNPYRNVLIVTPSDFLLLTSDTQQPLS